jgi:hypothetical protein
MMTSPDEIPFLRDTPVSSGKRIQLAISADRFSPLGTEDSLEEWQSQLQSLQQWLCELLIVNQQLRWALKDMKQLEPTETEDGPNESVNPRQQRNH